MNHPWQQPIRPLEVNPNQTPELWIVVLFIRPRTGNGWEVISAGGHTYNEDDAMLREVVR